MQFFDQQSSSSIKPPYANMTSVIINGDVREWKGDTEAVNSPVRKREAASGGSDLIEIGKVAMCDEATALEAMDAAVKAYDHGRGEWPLMKPRKRIEAVSAWCDGLAANKEDVVQLLMWEICKTRADAEKEVDRTVQYIRDTLSELKKLENSSSSMVVEGGVVAQIKRSPLGVAMVAGPSNYPLNEFATLFIPAVLMGNTCVIKIPRTGGLCHFPLFEVYAKAFPPGVVNVIAGSGRTCFTPIMKSGKINILAFIGSHKAALSLHNLHPLPFSVRLALGLDAKNPAFVLPSADLDVAAEQCALGAFSFNGQRCTAIKIIFVHESVADEFVKKMVAKVDALKLGLPWEEGTKITPLLEHNKSQYIKELVDDAVAKGAQVVSNGGKFFADRTICKPTVLYPVTLDSRVGQEEQFGPVSPILTYKDISELKNYMASTSYGQQAAVFSTNSEEIPPLIDFLAHQVTRINLNAQCQRGPDVMPFSGRGVSATGTLSVFDALRVMSIRVAIATKQEDANIEIFKQVLREDKSNVLSSDLLI